MRLKEIEINGFKSFGKKSSLQFTVPVTAIVGPNGSGKSNVVESFRFVLGEQSIKSMRGKSGSDLLFRGGGAALSRASVAITFDNSDKVFAFDLAGNGNKAPVLFDTVTFMREIFADGTSRYTVNGTEIRLRQMAELLASVHIGSSSHHIISQGEADGILRANAKERREILEDALGLKIYHQRIKETEQKLLKTMEALKEVQLLRRELAPHITFLKKQVEKAEKGKMLRDELQQMWSTYLIAEQMLLKKEDGRIKEAFDGITSQQIQVQAQLAALPQEQSAENNSLVADIATIKASLAPFEEKRRALEQKINRLEGMVEVQRRMVQQEKQALQAAQATQVAGVGLHAYGAHGAAIQGGAHHAGQHGTQGPVVVFSVTEYEKLVNDIANFITEIRTTSDMAAIIETLERFEHVVTHLKNRTKAGRTSSVPQQAQQQPQRQSQEQSPQQLQQTQQSQQTTVQSGQQPASNSQSSHSEALHETALQIEDLTRSLQSVLTEQKALQDMLAHKEMLREKSLHALQDSTALRYELRAKISQCDAELQVLTMAKKSFLERKELFDAEVREGTLLFGVAFLRTIEQREGNAGNYGTNDGLQEAVALTLHEQKRAIDRLKIRVDEHAGIGNEVFTEYESTKERDAFLAREVIDIEASIRNMESIIVDLKKNLDEKFTSGIQVINKRFNEFFTIMFGGGSAFLSITIEQRRRKQKDTDGEVDGVGSGASVGGSSMGALSGADSDEDDQRDNFFERGIEVHVSLPEKKVKDLHMLSGGERSLVSIALLFAISQVNPPPFLVLDETDAALDEANSRKYGDMIERLAEYSQLIVVTHNRETMSRAQVLYGVTLGADSASKLLSIKFDDAVKVAK